jgi:hypothetical protein
MLLKRKSLYETILHLYLLVATTMFPSCERQKAEPAAIQSVSRPVPKHTTLDDWIAREAIPFSVDSPESFNAAFDKVIASVGDSVELLGFGEALHGGEDILMLRNQLFQRLVETH